MCGRFTLATPPEILAALFGVESTDWNDPRFNIAPQVRIVTVRRVAGRRTAQSLLWGAPNPKDSRPLINARSETVATSPLFAHAFEVSRVLVPADGFFEWTKEGSRRQGRYFQQPGGTPFAFAGIAVSKPNLGGEGDADSAVILTTTPSDSVRSYHDRMPLIVPPDRFDLWLDAEAPLKTVNLMMSEGAKAEWRSHSVGPSVNNVRNDSPENIREAEPARDPQGSLF
jgi:putative SOS response-associated peptidase YedK